MTNEETWTDTETHYRWENVCLDYDKAHELVNAYARVRKARAALEQASTELEAAVNAFAALAPGPLESIEALGDLTRIITKIERSEAPKAGRA